MESFTIRPARLDDIDVLVRLRLALLHEYDAAQAREIGAALEAATRDYLLHNLETGGIYAGVAEVAGQVVACSGAVRFIRPPYPRNLAGCEIYILNMYTLPAWRRRGIASALLDDALQYARRIGAGRAWLHASHDGRSLYERTGFGAKGNEMELLLSPSGPTIKT